MRALRWMAPNDVRLVEVADPKAGHNEVVIRVLLAGMCMTDRELFTGDLAGIHPDTTPGHEILGIVDELGPGTDSTWLGQRVVVNTALPCRTCQPCLQGNLGLCTTPGELGFTQDGGWAERLICAEDHIYAVPDHLADEVAVLAEPYSCPLGALLDAGPPIDGARVLVVGDGLASIAFASSALALGALEVRQFVRHPERAKYFDPRVQVVSESDGWADVAVDTIGTALSFTQTFRSVRHKGHLVCYGLRSPEVTLPLTDLVLQNITISGHTNPRNAWPTLMSLLDSGTLRIPDLVDNTIALEEVPEWLRTWPKGLRTVISPGRG